MIRGTTCSWSWVTAAILLLIFAGCASEEKVSTTVILVRHADRTGDEDRLSPAGENRVQELQRVLDEVKIDAIYSTDYLRTRATVAPLASASNLQIQLYDSDDLTPFANRILKEHRGETILVSGHSNTTPQLINALGVEPTLPDLSSVAYDRLFIVTLMQGASPRLLTLQFGVDTP